MKKILFIGAVFLALAVTSNIAGAQTATSSGADATALQAQITALQNMITQLTAQIAELKKSSESLTQEVASLKLNRLLKQGDQGDDVKLLQQTLATDPSIFPEGSVTGFFGPKTANAVKKLQEKMGLEHVGNVGAKTMERINEILAEGAGHSGKIPPGLLKEHGHVITAKLLSQGDSNIGGYVMLGEQDGKVFVKINLAEKGDDRVASTTLPQPSHIHSGSCAATGPVKWALNPVVRGKSETALDITMANIASSTPLYVNVHKSDAEIATSVSCGDLHLPVNVFAGHDKKERAGEDKNKKDHEMQKPSLSPKILMPTRSGKDGHKNGTTTSIMRNNDRGEIEKETHN